MGGGWAGTLNQPTNQIPHHQNFISLNNRQTHEIKTKNELLSLIHPIDIVQVQDLLISIDLIKF